ncbi:MAG: DUF5701 family protein, partial [Nocardioides sp.]
MPYDPAHQFARQVDRLVELGYPGLSGLHEPSFRLLLEPLSESAARVPDQDDVPFVLVVTRELVRPEDSVPLLRLVGGRKPGVVDRNHLDGELATYQPLPELAFDG